MKHMFFYSRVQSVEGQEGQFKTFTDSFNVDKVIRTLEADNNELLVLLDDLHQRLQEIPVYNKTGKQTATKQVMNTFQSEITLSKEDSLRFKQISNIE